MGNAEFDRRRAKVRPEYTAGEVVSLTTVDSLPEAELVQNLLLEEGIPSDIRPASGIAQSRAPGIFVWRDRTFPLPGSYTVAVRESALEAGRTVLGLDA